MAFGKPAAWTVIALVLGGALAETAYRLIPLIAR
jgi:hypothetical protein